MPVILIDRIPLPSLQTYTTFSVLILSCSLYYAAQVTSQPGWKSSNVTDDATASDTLLQLPDGQLPLLSSERLLPQHGDNNVTEAGVLSLTAIIYYMMEEPLCVWTLINAAYCCLILLGKGIQKVVFGELRVSERQHIKDKFWNFVFYKFIFIFGVMNVQFFDEVILWCSWFSVLGFLHLLAQLSRDRFEYLSFSPTTPKWTHVRLISLLLGIMATSSVLFGICVLMGMQVGLYMFAFMGAECVLLNLRTLFVLVRYVIHLLDMNHEGVWENRGVYTYYTELIFEMAEKTVDLLHQVHMLLWGNIFLSMASLVICMQIRYLFYEIQRRFKKHKNYLNVVHHLEKNYPEGTAEDLAANSDDCAICWDKMESARKLPCGHLFHKSCLRSWLEQDTSCPTCRTSLATLRKPGQAPLSIPEAGVNALLPSALAGPPNHPPEAGQNRATTNHFFHFDGSRYVSWLPSFSVEVTHTQLLMERQLHVQTSQLDSMARQVQAMFPNFPLGTILGDLQTTRSIEVTVENILDERLVAPPFQLQTNRSPSETGTDPTFLETGGGAVEVVPNESAVESSSTSASEEIYATDSAPEESVTRVETTVAPPVFARVEALSACSSNDVHQGSGGRFSKSPQERERMLAQRKEELIRHTKRKYLASKYFANASAAAPTSGEIPDSSSATSSFDEEGVSGDGETPASLENKRYLAYQAAQRRLRQMHDDL